MLSAKQLRDVCLVSDGTYKKCRYLAQDENDWTKFHCVKKTSRSQLIDVELDDFIRDSQKKGKDPRKENIPMGDNCQGYPLLRHVEQGYDKKNP
jgi:hypothetical protein